MQVFLKTERLILRAFTPDDVDNLFDLHNNPDVMHIINGGRPSDTIIESYAAMNQYPVKFDLDRIRDLGVTPFFGDIIAEGNFVRHDPTALAQTVFRLYDRDGRTLERMRRTQE